jgi:3-hydroxyacyl-CoA dehydrogenase
LYAIWVKIDEAMPWIELSGTYQTKEEARRMAKTLFKKIRFKVVMVEKERRQMKAVVTVKR